MGEQAVRSFHWNGENWYAKDESIPRRFLGWLVWPGGWRAPEVTQAEIRFEGYRSKPMTMRLSRHRWDILHRYRPNERIHVRSITPLSLFGHRLTFFGWGAQVKLRDRSILVFAKNANDTEWRVYRSWDGTPSGAFVWYHGATPYEMGRVEDRVRRMQEAEAAR
jgi:hypothetical protein